MRILDACAAPGGKSAHIYESQGEVSTLVAIEKESHRINLLKDTQARLKIDMQIIEADAGETESWWDGNLFDRILVDAPCSATGVIRRHPDIKMLRHQEQMARLDKAQRTLLTKLWPLLRVGGRMVYATCSVLRQENDDQIHKLVEHVKDIKVKNNSCDMGN